MTVTAIFVLTLAGAGMISDLRTGKIGNGVIAAGLAAGFLLRLAAGWFSTGGLFSAVGPADPGGLSAGGGLFAGGALPAGGFLPAEGTGCLAAAAMEAAVFLAGAALPFLPGFLLFRFRMIGAGDVKLLMAVGGMIGPAGILRYMAVTVVFGAVISLLIMLTVTGIRPRIRYFLRYVLMTGSTGEILPYRDSPEAEFHFAVPVMMAAVVYAAGLI